MPNFKAQIMAKARGFTISIEKMGSQEKRHMPRGEFGRDYNKLLETAITRLPEIREMLPPSVDIFENAGGEFTTNSSYNEIDVYCEQIYQLAAQCDAGEQN